MKKFSKYSSLNSRAGFTLVELLVVIAIIGIISSTVYTNLQSSKSKSRDAKRISDIAQLQLALEQYFDKNSLYPDALSNLSPTYISKIPTDPVTKSNYGYNVTTDKSDYILSTVFESYNSALVDSWAGSFDTGGSSILCANDAAHLSYCVRSK